MDVVFMDPPRAGSTPEFLQAVSRMRPKKLVYIFLQSGDAAEGFGDIGETEMEGGMDTGSGFVSDDGAL